MCSIYAAPIAKLLGISFINGMVASAPSSLAFFSQAYCRAKLTFPMSDVIVANSCAGLKAFKVPKGKGVCIHNGFNFSRIQDLDDQKKIKQRFGINKEKVIGMVARFEDDKDYETFISSAKQILAKKRNVTFVAIGDGKNFERIQKSVEQNYNGKIRFLGKQDRVESIVNIFDIGVLATFTEGISNSIMEYMALSKPVVATRCGGTSELVVDGQSGFLVNPGSIKELTEKVEYLLDNQKSAETMGKAGRDIIRQNFNIKNF